MRFKHTVSVLILAVGAFIAARVSAVGAKEEQQSPSYALRSMNVPSQPSHLHFLYGGLWRTDGDFVSIVRIKNVLVVAPIQVTPILFLADGTPYPLPPVTLPVSGVAAINLNDALASAPRPVASHLSQFGSIILSYSYPSPGHIIASISAIDVPRSLSFVYPIVEPVPMPSDSKNSLEGLWWKHDVGVTGLISLTNTTDREISVAVSSIGHDDNEAEIEGIDLVPHTTRILALDQVSRAASNSRNTIGGIRIEYRGSRDSILVTGSLANSSEGYSANMPFSAHEITSTPPGKITMASVGLMVGKPNPKMMPGFPADTRFTPYLVLRNTTAKPIELALQLNYTPGDEALPVSRKLGTRHLRPFEAEHVELKAMLDHAGLKSFDGVINLSVSFEGHPGDLVAASGSVDQTSTYVFEVCPQAIGSSIGKITGYWSVANGNDTMFSLWNPTSDAQDIIGTIFYGDGSGTYHLPIHLAPQASTMLDIGMLVMQKTPDIDGKIIPANVQEGSASFDGAGGEPGTYNGKKSIIVTIDSGNFNVTNATCGANCTFCDGYRNFTLNPPSIFLLVGSIASFSAQATDAYGAIQTLQPDRWASDNQSVINNSSQAVGAGTTTFNGYFNNIITFQGQYCAGLGSNPPCPTQAVDDFGSVTVAPRLDSISKSKGLIGSTTSGIQINGAGFGSSPTVNAGSGITVTITSKTATQINANFVVSGSAPAGNHAVNVSAASQNSNSLNFYVQIPKKIVRTDFPPNVPGGYGPLVYVTNGNVVNASGTVLLSNQCGMYRNLVYTLQDQQVPAQAIDGTYTFTESFSNYSSTIGLGTPPPQSHQAVPGALLADIQYLGKTAPNCPGANDHEAFDQSHSVTIGTTVYQLTTVNHIQRGNYAGVHHVDVTITTP